MNFLRAIRTISSVGVGRVGMPGRAPFALVQPRCFAKSQYQEPPYMVVDEEEDGETGEDIKVPIMPDHIRQEMFTKYMQDQEQWSYQNLSKHYGSSLIRTKAIILLMQRRHNMIADAETTLRRLAGEETEQQESSGALKLLPIVDIPSSLRALYAKHKEDVSVPLGALISAHNDALTESGSSEKRVTIEEKDLKAAFDIIARITQRQENFEEATEAQEEEVEDLHGDLIETDFRESPTEFRTSKAHNYLNRPNKHVRQSFQHNYYPTLASDKNAKREEVRLLRRIEEETKAQLEHDVEYYERKYALQSPAEALQEARSTPLPAALQHHQPPAAGAPLSRWKIAFQDLSTSAVPKTKKSLRVPDRTVIRTRAGELRYATPVEEASVSWRVRPSGLDRGLALEIKHHRERLVDPYVDVDRDEQQLREQRTARKEKRKALMEAAGVAK